MMSGAIRSTSNYGSSRFSRNISCRKAKAKKDLSLVKIAQNSPYHHLNLCQKLRIDFLSAAADEAIAFLKYISFASRSFVLPASISSRDHIPAHRTDDSSNI